MPSGSHLPGMRAGSHLSLSSVTKVTKASKNSIASSASTAGCALKRGLTYIASIRPTSKAPAGEAPAGGPGEPAELPVGSQGETLSLVTMRQGEALDSGVVLELPVGTVLEVLEHGADRRLRVRAGGAEGWVSSRTRLGELLVARRRTDMDLVTEDFEVGGQHEVKSVLTVRAEEALDSAVVAELRPGALVRILALGRWNARRARVAGEAAEGWISLATKQGELLVGKLSSGGGGRAGAFGASGAKVKELLEAARGGDLEVVRRIAEGRGGVLSKFSSRPNLNCSDIRGKTALIYAAAFGKRDVVEYLLTKTREVDVNAVDDTKKNALHHASKRAKACRTWAYDRVQPEIIAMLLHGGIVMEARDHNGCTALMFAVANGDEAVVRTLLTSKANVAVRDFENHAPLDYAREFGHAAVEQLLLSAGAEDDCEPEADGEEAADVADAADAAGEFVAAEAAETAEDTDVVEAAEAVEAGGTPGAARSSAMASAAAEAGAGAETTAEAAEGAPALVGAGPAAPEGGAGEPAGAAEPGVGECAAAEGAEAGAAPRKSAAKKKKGEREGGEERPAGEKREKGKEKEKEKEKAKGKEREKEKEKDKDKEKGSKKEKGEKSSKGKKDKAEGGPKKRRSCVGMMEAVEVQEEAVEVTVVAEAAEEVDEKKVALAKLAALVETSTSPGELEAAIKLAQANGAEQADVAEASKVLQQLRARQQARDALRVAVEGRQVAELRAAIAEAEAQQVPGPAVDEARKVLAEEEPRQEAREQLQAARKGGSTADLKAALAGARAVGLAAAELVEFEELLAGAESKGKAEEALRAAIREVSVDNLRLAINQAAAVGVDQALLEEAERVLREEEPRAEARALLAGALERPSKAALTAAIDAARAAKLEASECREAEEALRREEEKERLLAAVRQVLAEVQTVESEVEALRAAKERLSGAIDAAIQAGVSEGDLAEADTRRKKLHNAVEDLKGSIRVYCRVRPLSKKELGQGDTSVTEAVNSMTIKVDSQQFQFDSVWTPGTQEEVFEDCRDLVQSAVDGYNVTMFAYGQTGAGKTFTMYGAPGMEGTAPRTIQEIFRVIERGTDRFSYTVMGSMLELYRNDLVDLLSKGDPKASKQKLNVRQEKSGAVTVEHLTEGECVKAEELAALLERGNAQRTVAATAMNSESSRSHLVLIIRIVSVNRETKEKLQGKILICDLAGSERLKKSQVEAHMQKEAIEINKSLTALGDVIEALTKSAKVIPYRNHKLTQLMQDALGGSAKTLMFVNCSPANSNLDETLMSLKYATRAKKITNTAAKKG